MKDFIENIESGSKIKTTCSVTVLSGQSLIRGCTVNCYTPTINPQRSALRRSLARISRLSADDLTMIMVNPTASDPAASFQAPNHGAIMETRTKASIAMTSMMTAGNCAAGLSALLVSGVFFPGSVICFRMMSGAGVCAVVD